MIVSVLGRKDSYFLYTKTNFFLFFYSKYSGFSFVDTCEYQIYFFDPALNTCCENSLKQRRQVSHSWAVPSER